MKHLKKLGSVLLALVMVMALAAPAFATPTTSAAPSGDGPTGDPSSNSNAGSVTNGSIEVRKAVEGASTTIYKIFDLAQYDRDTGAYIYKVNSAWAPFFAAGGAGESFITTNENGDVSWAAGMDTSAQMNAFVAAAMAYAKTNPSGLVSVTKQNNTGAADAPKEGEIQTYTLTFDSLQLGYYLVSSTDGTMCSLNTNAPKAVITNKNRQSIVDKDPEELTTEIGKPKAYDITFTAYPTGVTYTVTDTPGTGLSFSQEQFEAITVTAGGTTLAPTNYTAEMKDGGFEIVFPQTYVEALPEAGVEIVIHYEMTVTPDAVVGYVENDVILNYGPNKEVTSTSKPKVYTYNFDLVKTNKEDTLLNGAEFELYYDQAMTQKVPLVKTENGGYRVAVAGETDVGKIEVTNGVVNIAGLDATTYWLKETKAPTAYNPVKEAIEVKIEAVNDANNEPTKATVNGNETSATVDLSAKKYTKDGVEVENNTGTELPSTGGIGTTIFYIVGGVLVVGAVVVLVAKRRTGMDEE